MNNFAFPASLTYTPTLSTLVAFNVDAENPVYVADSHHPHWDDILNGLYRGDPEVWSLFDVAKGVMDKFAQVTERVSYNGTDVLWDGDPIHSVLANQLLRALEDGDSQAYTALALFWEDLESNPSEHSREQTYEFLATHAFQITPEGKVVAYKGVTDCGNGNYRSNASSSVKGKPSAYVNGKPIPELSTVPQRVGDVVSMPRSEVVHNPSLSCERGLHVATREYANNCGLVLEVHVNARDFVSVPTDAGGAKVRVCRYEVARVAQEATGGAVLRASSSTNTWAGDVGYRV